MPVVTLKNAVPYGPLIEVAIGPSVLLARQRKIERLPPIYPEIVPALLDTGARQTFIDRSLVKKLELIVTGGTEISGVGTDGQILPAEMVDISLAWTQPIRRDVSGAIQVVAANLDQRVCRAIIGRDLLGRCLLVYNGPQDEFTLSF